MAELDLARVKRNVSKMVSQGAPESDIDAYISGEGTTVDAIKAFKPGPAPDVMVDAAKGLGFGFNEGLDATLNMIGSPIRAPINAISGALGYGEVIPELNAARRFNVAGPAETTTGRTFQAVGEVAGGTVLPTAGMLTAGRMAGAAAPGIISQYANAPAAAAGLDAVAAGGAGLGVAAARENDLGPLGEIAGGLAGGIAVPNAVNAAARTVAGVRSGVDYANRAVRSASNPEQAAVDVIADRMVQSGIDPVNVRNQVAPQPSAQLARRNTPAGRPFNAEDMADIVARSAAGETADDIGRAYGIGGQTVRNYVQQYRNNNPTPMNLMDIATDQANAGGASPILRLGRAAFSLAGDEANTASQRLVGRQENQAGRVSNIVQRSVANGDFEATRTAGLQNLRNEADQAYWQFYQEPELAINQLEDLMGDPLFRRANIQAQRQARVETIRRNQQAARAGRPQEPVPEVDPNNEVFTPQMLDLIQRQLRIASEGAVSNPNNARHARNLREVFLDRIEAHYPTFRQIRRDYATGLGEFGEEGALEAGRQLVSRLGANSSEALREFGNYTPAQQELFRLGFARKLMDDAANRQVGGAVANQFNTPAVREIVMRLFSGPADVQRQGQALLRDLRREAITTNTKNKVLEGARTAELSSDMGRLMEGAQTAADLTTGRWGKLIENLSTRLTTQIGQRSAAEVSRLLTETEPSQLLPLLNRLARSARTRQERQAYVAALREFGRASRRPAAEIGTVTSRKE